jgi:hypothetical protein
MNVLVDPPDHADGGDNDPEELVQAVKVFTSRLHLPSPDPLYATLGAVAANRMRGDPVWLLQVGPPSSGKTELVGSLAKLRDVRFAALLTEAALLSGTAKKERAADATGGLLRQVGKAGILVMKDFTSTLAQQRDTRAAALAALREVYDGHWSRPVGSEGGRVLHWSGKLGLVAGCTPAIDAHHAVLSSLGDRFVLYRLPATDPAKQGAMALDRDDDDAMRAELADAVAALFAAVTLPAMPPKLAGAERDRMVAVATLAARCRSAVPRDGYKQEIQYVPEAEPPARLARTLWRLLEGMSVLGVPRPDAWRVAVKVALDCMPSGRRAALDALATGGEQTTKKVALAAWQPTNTIRRALEDLAAHGIADREAEGPGKPDHWRLSDRAQPWLAAALPDISGTPPPTVPEMSGSPSEPSTTLFADPDPGDPRRFMR